VAEEAAVGDPAVGLGLEGGGGVRADAAGGQQGVGAAPDERGRVAGVAGLQVAVAAHRHRPEPARSSRSGSRRTSQGSWTLDSTQAWAQAWSGSAGPVATVVVA
jgi:hypothetical protein